jgi:pimeloyl-ACP methyl ester carboxylesterase
MDRARQAEAAIHFITGQTGVDPTLVGVWGQSQGGWIVQILAGRVPELPFAVANSGPSIGVAEQDRYGLEHTMRAAGFSDEHIDAALALLNDGTVAVASGMPFEEAQETLIGQAAGEPWEAYLTIEDSRDWELFRRFVVEGYDPHQSLRSIKCPFLAIYGAKDVLLPAWQSAHETGQCLVESGARDAAVVVFPAGNHRIQDDETGEFVEGYLDLLAAWVSRRAKRLDAEPAVLC